MPLVTLSSVVVRAPLLPAHALADAARALLDDPLGTAALALASEDLLEALGRRGRREPSVARALSRYARRAAFRPTPHGLWAGVTVGTLGEQTDVATGRARGVLAPSWGWLAALGRGLLDDPEVRAQARVRRAPSLLRRGDRLVWLRPGADDGTTAEPLEAELDETLEGILDAASSWAPFLRVATCVAGGDADELLLALIDDGLLVHDLEPPLVGPPPGDWMRARLARLRPAPPTAALVEDALARLRAADASSVAELIDTRRELASLAPGDPLHAVLVLDAPRPPTIARAVVERAAALAPLLVRLQEALAPPGAERDLDPGAAAALEAITERFGAGALDLGWLAAGGYGAPLAPPDAAPLVGSAGPVDAGVVAYLADRVVDAARAGAAEVHLDPAELDGLLPEAPLPATFEVLLTPCREPRGAPPGTGWLLGLHAPAGATVGRFAHAAGAPLVRALAELAEAERQARAGEQRLDVAYAPTRALGDLAAHPPVRARALALSSWPESDVVTPDDLELVADAAALEPLALRADGHPVVPSPLARLRSTTAPAGAYQLLTGWSLQRQHAPWSFVPGPLAALAWLPRVVVDGFVVAPASWRLPTREEATSPAAVAAWRRRRGVPRWLQVGHQDELLPLDLDERAGRTELVDLIRAGATRAHEVWPPLDRTARGARARVVDRDGRRVEVVASVVAAADDRAVAASVATAAAGRVPPPVEAPAAAGWTTYKLFGAADRQDRVLLGAVAGCVREALAVGELGAWFFLRYDDPPGHRDHLRLRVRTERPARFAARLERALAPARRAGDLVAVEVAPYHREVARYGGAAALAAAERLFQLDSELACALLGGELASAVEEADLDELLVRVFDATAAGLGLDLPARRDLAGRRRAAHEASAAAAGHRDDDELRAADYRRRQRRLLRALEGSQADAAARLLAAHAERLAPLRAAIAPSALPALLHLSAVRLAGADAEREAHASYLWDRALASLAATRRPSPRRTPGPR